MRRDPTQTRPVRYLDYQRVPDSDIVPLAQMGDRRALHVLIGRYRDFVRLKCRPYFLIGADYEDIVQEGMIGLYKAIRDYRSDRAASFKAFAEICITRQVITAVKTATRQKHAPLNSYISLNSPSGGEESEPGVFELISQECALDPAEMVIGGEEAQSIKDNFWKMLSDFETEVLRLYIKGFSYQRIAVCLDRDLKSIDNALQRIKRKIEHHLYRRERLAGSFRAKAGAQSRGGSHPGPT